MCPIMYTGRNKDVYFILSIKCKYYYMFIIIRLKIQPFAKSIRLNRDRVVQVLTLYTHEGGAYLLQRQRQSELLGQFRLIGDRASDQSELLGQFRLIGDRASDVSGGRICLTQNAYAHI